MRLDAARLRAREKGRAGVSPCSATRAAAGTSGPARSSEQADAPLGPGERRRHDRRLGGLAGEEGRRGSRPAGVLQELARAGGAAEGRGERHLAEENGREAAGGRSVSSVLEAKVGRCDVRRGEGRGAAGRREQGSGEGRGGGRGAEQKWALDGNERQSKSAPATRPSEVSLITRTAAAGLGRGQGRRLGSGRVLELAQVGTQAARRLGPIRRLSARGAQQPALSGHAACRSRGSSVSPAVAAPSLQQAQQLSPSRCLSCHGAREPPGL